jgi:hypothetical protein
MRWVNYYAMLGETMLLLARYSISSSSSDGPPSYV